MKLEQIHIDEIRQRFSAMSNKEDLLDLLNYVKPFIYGKKSFPFELKQITFFANPKVAGKRYISFNVDKKSGGKRTIHAPMKGLKAIQRCLNVVLQCVFEPHRAAYGFVQERSIVDNARVHANSHYIYNIDLKDFFPSIDQARVWKCFQLHPFNLSAQKEFVKIDVNGTKDSFFIPADPVIKKRRDKVLIFSFSGKDYIKGFRIINLTNGLRIAYSVTLDSNKKGSGNLVILKEKTDLERIKAIAEKLRSDRNLAYETNTIVDYLLETTIDNDQETLTKKRKQGDLANILAALCCTEMEVERLNKQGQWEIVKRNVLPQGAPTSPLITNIVCQRLDFLLTAVAKRFGCKYSRYADDLTFSSLHNIYQESSEFLKEVERIVTEQGFHIKPSKTRLQKTGYRQEVTGLVVNEEVNVRRRYIKQLRKWLYLWEKYGYNKANTFFEKDYAGDKGHVKKAFPLMEKVIKGRLNYLKMVKGADNKLCSKLLERFNRLATNNSVEITDKSDKNLEAVEAAGYSIDNNLSNRILAILTKQKIKASQKRIVESKGYRAGESKAGQIGKDNKRIIPFLEEFNRSSAKVQSAKSNHVLPEAVIQKKDIEKESKMIYLNPIDTVRFLKDLNQNPVLKATTHPIDLNMMPDLLEALKLREYDYNVHYNHIKEELANISNTVKTTKIYAKVATYLLSDFSKGKGWSSDSIQLGWGCVEVQNWCLENEGLVPSPYRDLGYEGLKLDSVKRLRNGDTLTSFNDVVNYFKGQTEFRGDKGTELKTLIKNYNRIHYRNNCEFNTDGVREGIRFYSDVEKVMQAYRKIIDECIEFADNMKADQPKIEVNLEESISNDSRVIILTLHHLNTVFGKSLESFKDRKGTFFTDTARNLINGLCDWRMEAEFPNSEYCLVDICTKDMQEMKLQNATGVKHQLIFYR